MPEKFPDRIGLLRYLGESKYNIYHPQKDSYPKCPHAEYLPATPLLEHAGEMRKLVKSQKRLITSLRREVEYYSVLKASHEKDFLPQYVPREIKLMKRALKYHKKATDLLATIKEEEEQKEGDGDENN